MWHRLSLMTCTAEGERTKGMPFGSCCPRCALGLFRFRFKLQTLEWDLYGPGSDFHVVHGYMTQDVFDSLDRVCLEPLSICFYPEDSTHKVILRACALVLFLQESRTFTYTIFEHGIAFPPVYISHCLLLSRLFFTDSSKAFGVRNATPVIAAL